MSVGWPRRYLTATVALVAIFAAQGAASPASPRAAKDKPVEKQSAPEPPRPKEKGKSAQPSKAQIEKPIKPESKSQLAKETGQRKAANRQGAKTRRQGPKKLPPRAINEPKPDWSYMGQFQAPQRYDPSHDFQKGGPLNPQAGDVLHEHFQELDRNRDGVIDPLERASSRLDIDRDLVGRRWQ
jgi:hypothetical protein